MTYGFIGLGSMGTPMAGHLADHCVANSKQLLVWNRNLERATPLTNRGASVVPDPAQLFSASDVVVIMLPDLPQLVELTDGPHQLLSLIQRPLVLIICSSVSPQEVRKYAAHAAQITNGLVDVVDAPVSGGTEGATDGTLAIMAGGSDTAVATAWPALSAMGTTIRHLGPIGSGALAKACNQMVVAATMIALSEASALAESAGVSVNGLLEVLAGGLAASRVMEIKAHNFTSRTYEATGKARYMIKDLGFVHAEAKLTGADVSQAELSLQLYSDVDKSGLGDDDVSVVHALIRSRCGLLS